MKGYLNNEEATVSAITDGRLHTGDFGKLLHVAICEALYS